MRLQDRVLAFTRLGKIMTEAAGDNPHTQHGIRLRELMERQEQVNKWFTPENVRMAVRALGDRLSPSAISEWMANYTIPELNRKPLGIGVVMAGNIPLVGFNDMFNVLISGNRLVAKSSSKDSQLIRSVADIISELEPGFKSYIDIISTLPESCDAIIATGSDNSSRYFKYHFADKPHIFRKNRTSVSLITNNTTDDELKVHGTDLFSYFGMGCRNVSKIYAEKGFDLKRLQYLWSDWSYIAGHSAYKNNYKHNRALMIVEQEKFIDGGFFLLKESDQTASPLSVIHYEYFDKLSFAESSIASNSEKIQCVISSSHIPFGRAQQPNLSDFADNIDTMKFLLSLK